MKNQNRGEKIAPVDDGGGAHLGTTTKVGQASRRRLACPAERSEALVV